MRKEYTMPSQVSAEDREQINVGIREKYNKVAMSEIIRVLKPAGRLMVADQIAAGSVQKNIKARFANWFQ